MSMTSKLVSSPQAVGENRPTLSVVVLFVLTLTFHASVGHCQFYSFNNLPVPLPFEPIVVYRFFAYVASDPPPLSINAIPIGLTAGEFLTFPLFGYNKTAGKERLLQSAGMPSSLSNANDKYKRTTLLDEDRSTHEPNPSANDLSTPQTSGNSLEKIVSNSLLANSGTGLEETFFDEQKNLNQGASEGANDFGGILKPHQAEKNTRDQTDVVTELVFDNVRLDTEDGIGERDSVQLSVMSYTDFWKAFLEAPLEDPPGFCCLQEDVDSGRCQNMYQFIVPPGVQFFKSVTIGKPSENGSSVYGIKLPTSDIYVLIVSNCGIFEKNMKAKVSGSVYLHNYYGYLPGIDAPKTSFYIFLAAFYVLLMIIFAISAVRHRTQLIHIHVAIAGVLTMCLVETLIWFTFYQHRNMYPARRNVFFCLAIVTTVIKNMVAFILVLVASLGWGMTKPFLSVATKRKIYLIIISYIIFDSARQIVTQLRMAHEIPFPIILSCLLPISLLQAIIFFWIFSSLAELIEELKSTRQEIKLALFLKFWTVLMFTIFGAIAFLCAELFTVSQDNPNNWRMDYIFTDVAPNSAFIVVLLAMIVLWAPSRNSKAMAYSSELHDEDTQGQGLGSRVLGRGSLAHESPLAKGAMGKSHLNLDDDDNDHSNSKLEMSAASVDPHGFKLWGKRQQQPLKDLDYYDDNHDNP